MPQGVGVRYNSNGVRILKLEQVNEGLKVSGIAVGMPSGSLDSFMNEQGISTADAPLAFGLGPGDFITASIRREKGMDDSEMQEQLQWEIERKLISEPSEYNFDSAMVNDIGFMFAGRKKIISEMIQSNIEYFTDVEPIALYNGCERAGEMSGEKVMLVSVEAEGVSSVVVEGGVTVALESFPIKVEEIASVLPSLDPEGMSKIDVSIVERLADYVLESVKRLTSLGENKDNPTPEKLVLAGGGVYAGELADIIGKKSGMATTLSDPFSSLINDVNEIQPELSGRSAAFTTCFGLALRAMEI